jgi:golgi to ER traffic protein 4
MSAKIAKTMARQREKIAEGNYYEAHQQLRVITARYLKSKDYDSACEVLQNGSVLLLKAGQGGSGGDLAMMLLKDVYITAELECNETNKAKLLEILRAFPKDEPTRKRFIQEMIGWSGRFGDIERGDPELHYAAGSIYAEEGDAYAAEHHLLLGTKDSAPLLARLHYSWYATDSPHLAAIYASRSVLPYLVLGNLASATTAYSTFTSQLTTTNPALFTQSIESSKSSNQIRVFPSLPLLNFLSLVLLSCQKGDASLFKSLGKHYMVHLKETDDLWSEAMANIGEIWFGIRIPKQRGNPLMDMMGGMLFGGGNTPKPSTPRSGTPKPKGEGAKKEAGGGTPVGMDLD